MGFTPHGVFPHNVSWEKSPAVLRVFFKIKTFFHWFPLKHRIEGELKYLSTFDACKTKSNFFYFFFWGGGFLHKMKWEKKNCEVLIKHL